MEFFPSTVFVLVVMVFIARRGAVQGLPLLLALTPFGAAAAFNLPAVGGASIGILDLGAVFVFCLVVFGREGFSRGFGSMRPYQPGFFLLLLTIYCVIATMFFPRVFEGATQVFGISREDNVSRIVEVPLRATTGNLTQLFRILLDVMAFYAIATAFRIRPDADIVFKGMVTATLVHVTLGWLDFLTFYAGVGELLDPIRTANYSMLTTATMAGLKRMVGGFPEASSYGYYTVGLLGFWLQYFISGPKSRLTSWCLVLTVVALVLSTSSSSYVATVVLLLFFGLSAVRQSSDGRVGRQSLSLTVIALIVLWFMALTIFAAYELIQPVTAYLDSVLFTKLDSSSGQERMSWNAQAAKNFMDTWMMGAGLGSIRASNWLLACLGSIGMVGTILYFAFLATVARQKIPDGTTQEQALVSSLKRGCLGTFISAMLTTPTPDFGIFFFILAGLIVGLSRGIRHR